MWMLEKESKEYRESTAMFWSYFVKCKKKNGERYPREHDMLETFTECSDASIYF